MKEKRCEWPKKERKLKKVGSKSCRMYEKIDLETLIFSSQRRILGLYTSQFWLFGKHRRRIYPYLSD